MKQRCKEFNALYDRYRGLVRAYEHGCTDKTFEERYLIDSFLERTFIEFQILLDYIPLVKDMSKQTVALCLEELAKMEQALTKLSHR